MLVVLLCLAMETTSAVHLSTNETSADAQIFDLQYIIWVFVLPFVLLVGIIGNIMSVIVLHSKAFRYTTTGVYLPLTAIADTVFLLTGSLEILDVAEVFDFREYNVWTCRVYKVVFYTAGDVSIWLLVAFTFDRFIAVCFPLKKSSVCRWKRAAIASGTILFLALAKNFHEFWTRGPEYIKGKFYRICGTQAQYAFFLDYVRPWIAFLLIMVIPFVLLFLLNCMIVYSLIKAQRMRSKAAAAPACTATTGTGNKPQKSTASFRQTTLMCLSISFAFLICMAPSIVLLIGKPYWKHRSKLAYENAKAICNLLGFVNHCINFFLYCVTGRRFRQELKAKLTCGRVEVRPTSPTSVSTQNDVTMSSVQYR